MTISPQSIQCQGRDNSNEEWEAISYPIAQTGQNISDQIPISSSVISQDLTSIVGRVKIDNCLRERIEMVGTAYKEIGEVKTFEIQSNMVGLFSHILPDQMAEMQGSDNQIGHVLRWVQEGKTPPKSVLYKIKSKSSCKLFYQLDRLVLEGDAPLTLHSRRYGVPSVNLTSETTRESTTVST